MTFVERFKSFLEQQLDGWGPQDLVSVGAEMGVAVCVFVPLFAASVVGRWAMRKYNAHQGTAAPAEFGSCGNRLGAVNRRL